MEFSAAVTITTEISKYARQVREHVEAAVGSTFGVYEPIEYQERGTDEEKHYRISVKTGDYTKCFVVCCVKKDCNGPKCEFVEVQKY